MSFVFLVVLTMLYFVNTIYYTLALLVVTCVCVFSLVLNSYIQALTGIILLLVYLGAMIILIGYICAVSPNLILKPKSLFNFVVLVTLASLFSLLSAPLFCAYSSVSTPLVYFFSAYGGAVFTLIAIILFVTLLIVTTQFFSPNGPFRSVL